MNDLLPHKHADESKGSTHYCCNSRLKKEKGKARCCECVPHENCDYDQKVAEQTITN